MRFRHWLLCIATGLSTLALRAEDRELAKSPKGDFAVVAGDDGQDWVVSASRPAQREKLGPKSEMGSGDYSISPDEKWILSRIHIGSGMSGAALFRRKEGLHFAPFTGEDGRIDELLWKAHEHAIGQRNVKAEDEELNMVDFVSFSPDSARILLSLRGGEKRGAGYFGWLVYLNLRTGKLEQTAYLKAKSRGAEKRWTNDDSREQWTAPASAEPVDPLPDEAQLKSRWQEADQRLNAVYGKLRALDKKEDKSYRVKQQREWIAQRDAGAAEYAKAGAAETQGQRRWQFMADATEIRVEELERELADHSSQ